MKYPFEVKKVMWPGNSAATDAIPSFKHEETLTVLTRYSFTAAYSLYLPQFPGYWWRAVRAFAFLSRHGSSPLRGIRLRIEASFRVPFARGTNAHRTWSFVPHGQN
ncbi:hypothetical protein A4G99_06050 [Haladaptatus sp. R4]|nr:hypothetical protein A4G99_06050 [Haladaptatus sp. R4]